MKTASWNLRSPSDDFTYASGGALFIDTRPAEVFVVKNPV
jgi:hypothetical protein